MTLFSSYLLEFELRDLVYPDTEEFVQLIGFEAPSSSSRRWQRYPALYLRPDQLGFHFTQLPCDNATLHEFGNTELAFQKTESYPGLKDLDWSEGVVHRFKYTLDAEKNWLRLYVDSEIIKGVYFPVSCGGHQAEIVIGMDKDSFPEARQYGGQIRLVRYAQYF